MIKSIILQLSVLLSMFFTFDIRAEYDPSKDLISAFCQDVGPFTKIALKQISAIKDIIVQLKEDVNCKNIASASQSYLDELTIYQSDYFNNEKNENRERESRIYEDAIEREKVQIISAHMDIFRIQNPNASASDIALEEATFDPSSDVLTSLNDQYGQLQINSISTKIRSGNFNSTKTRASQYKVMQGLQHGLKGLYGVLHSSSQCRHDNTNIITQLGATVLGTAGNIYGGIVGAALIAGGLVVTGTGELIRDLKFNGKISDLENENIQYAMGCSLEGISKNYCQARDVQNMLKFNLKNEYKEDASCEDCGLVYDGIDLLARKVFAYNKWINRILAGSIASSDAQAQERNKASALSNKLRYIKEEMSGSINQTSTIISQLPGGEEGKEGNSQLIQLMQKLAFKAQNNVFICESRNSCDPGPYRAFFALDPNCGPKIFYYSQGISKVKRGGERESCDDYVLRMYPDLSWLRVAALRGLSEYINTKAQLFVNTELQRVLEENADRVMADFTVIDTRFRTSPSDFFKGLEAYLTDLVGILNKNDHKLFLRLIGKTLVKLEQAGAIVNRECDDKTTIYCDIAAAQIFELGVLMAPKQQSFSLENALRTIVTMHLDMLIEEGRIPNKLITHLIKYSNQNSPQFIINNYFKIHDLQKDTANAKVMTLSILRNLGNQFLKRYHEYLSKQMKYLKKNSWDKDVLSVVSERCFQFLHMPVNDSGMINKRRIKKIYKLCKDTVYISNRPGKVASLKFSEVSKLNHNERICALYDFRRKLSLIKLINPRGERKEYFTPIK